MARGQCGPSSSRLRTLIVPGLHGSGPAHWQSLWLGEHPEYEQVTQKDWATPDIEVWSDALVRKVRERAEAVVVAAHSFGCLATVHALAKAPGLVCGGLLVAPPDPARLGAWGNLADVRLGSAWTVVASRNDPWMPFDRALAWAAVWSSRLADAGFAGHINVASGHGPWIAGERLLAQVHAEVAVTRHAAAARG